MTRLATGRRGMTLIEVVIAIAVFAVVIVAILGALSEATETFRQGVSSVQVEEQPRRILDLLANELVEARLVQVSADGCLLAVQVPVEVGGTVYTAGNALNWGAEGQVGWSIRYAMVSHPTPQVLDEVADKVDYNGDLLIQDLFERVCLRRSVVNAVGVEVRGGNLSGLVLVPYPPDPVTGLRPLLNMDGDAGGVVDLPFQRVTGGGSPSPTGAQVRITVWVQRTRSDGHHFVSALATRAYLRNNP